VRAPGDAELEALWHEWHRHVLAYALRRADPTTAEDAGAAGKGLLPFARGAKAEGSPLTASGMLLAMSEN
jgi:hypothetical protein